MKFFLILTSLILFIINPIKAIDLKIAYIDTDKILNESMVGKNLKKRQISPVRLFMHLEV